MLSKLLSWIVLRTRSDTTKEIEILGLRHPPHPPRSVNHSPSACPRDPPTADSARNCETRAILWVPETRLTRCPPLDHSARPARSTRHRRRPARPGPPPGHREFNLGYRRIHGE